LAGRRRGRLALLTMFTLIAVATAVVAVAVGLTLAVLL
jgi:hypothetical protein